VSCRALGARIRINAVETLRFEPRDLSTDWHYDTRRSSVAVNFLGFDSLMARLTENLHLAFAVVQVGLVFPAVVRTTLATTQFAIARRSPNRSPGSERDLFGRVPSWLVPVLSSSQDQTLSPFIVRTKHSQHSCQSTICTKNRRNK
jgi:hypothetical protein